MCLLSQLLKLLVTFSSCKDYIHPNSHGLRRRGHQKVGPFSRFHAKCHFGIRWFDVIQVVHVDFFDRLEIHSTFGFAFTFVRVVNERAFIAVKNEPSLVPFRSETLDRGWSILVVATQFLQVTSARVGREEKVGALIQLVTSGLDVTSEIEVFVTYG